MIISPINWLLFNTNCEEMSVYRISSLSNQLLLIVQHSNKLWSPTGDMCMLSRKCYTNIDNATSRQVINSETLARTCNCLVQGTVVRVDKNSNTWKNWIKDNLIRFIHLLQMFTCTGISYFLKKKEKEKQVPVVYDRSI